jgi:glycosyltransferase involved in cell wall biosynthesis
MNSITQGTQKTKPIIVAAIPCLNEEKFIGTIVAKARRYVDEVIVVDDGSTDDTALAAGKAGAKVIAHKSRQGAGAATRTAFQAAKRDDADVLVTLDGDGQHNPDEIPQVLAPILCRKADLVIGSRFLNPNLKDVPGYRKFGIDVITWLYNIGSKIKVTDSQSCFRAYSRRLIEIVDITEDGFGFSVQLLIQARKKGLAIMEVPVSCIYHSNGSTINPVTHGLGVAFNVIKLRLSSEVLARIEYGEQK